MHVIKNRLYQSIGSIMVFYTSSLSRKSRKKLRTQYYTSSREETYLLVFCSGRRKLEEEPNMHIMKNRVCLLTLEENGFHNLSLQFQPLT